MAEIRVSLREARDDSYGVIVGRGAMSRLPDLLKERCRASAYAVIADHKVAELRGAALMASLQAAGLKAGLLTFPAGEWNKSRDQWAELTDRMLALGIGRDGAVVALGGGVAGDLAGFVAATYLRGIPYAQVPTSLLAMIDSSVGGKTGIDVPAGKNLVGAFHQPRFVLADVECLATLPKAHIAAGMAEAIKHGVISDARYFDSLGDAAACFARDLDRLEEVVRRSVEIKASVVAADERETGRRQILNFGHTIGHALETLSGFDLLHGEAVAIGMAIEAGVAERAGIAAQGTREKIVAMLERYQLPSEMPAGMGWDRLSDVMRHDKKSRNARIRFALPRSVGVMAQSDDGAWTVEVEEGLIKSCM